MKGIKDRDNQPVGSDLSEGQVSSIKEAEEALELIKARYAQTNGLTREEAGELDNLMGIKRKKTPEESKRIEELVNKKKDNGLDTFTRNQIDLILKELREFQSKVPTDYYKDILDKKFSELNIEPFEKDEEYDNFLGNDTLLDELFRKSPRFKDWFLKNHIETQIYDPTIFGMRSGYKRLYIWDRTVPEDPGYYESTTLSDDTVVPGVPNYEYFRRVVKDQYKTKQEVGKTVDMYGNFLPKDVKGSPFIDDSYNQLSHDEKSFLDILVKNHMKAQEGLTSYYAQLDYDIPRYAKDVSEGK